MISIGITLMLIDFLAVITFSVMNNTNTLPNIWGLTSVFCLGLFFIIPIFGLAIINRQKVINTIKEIING